MNKIYVDIDKNNNAILSFPEFNIKTKAFIGKNGYTYDKKEGDGKTPLGEFELGMILTFHDEDNIQKITDDLYFVDDSNSKYYNTIVSLNEVDKDFSSAEHLIDFSKQYEYFVEIKYNKEKIPNKGSCIVLHCKNLDYTEGCVSIDSNILKKITHFINKETKIVIRES